MRLVSMASKADRHQQAATQVLFYRVLHDPHARLALARAMREGKNIAFQLGDKRISVTIRTPDPNRM